MKAIIELVLLCAAMGFVVCNSDYNESIEGEVPAFDSYSDYVDCVDQGACPVDVEVTSVAPEHHTVVPTATESVQVHEEYSYGQLCHKLSSKMEELGFIYPELNAKKVQLLHKLISYTSSFDSTCNKGESIIEKILDFVIIVAQQLREKHGEKPEIFEPEIVEPEFVEPDFLEPEIIAEEEYGFVGSVRGIPGEDYPNYSEIPITSFSCSDKYIPGFYADLETGCQVFHVCYEHRRESFLCPLGTTFNQPILACDYWYSSNCSQAPDYYDINEKTEEITEQDEEIEEIVATVIEQKPIQDKIPKEEFKHILPFLPVKSKVIELPAPSVPSPKVVGKLAHKIVSGAKVMAAAKMTDAISSAKGELKLKVAGKIKGKLEEAAVAKVKVAVASKKVKVAALPVVKAKVKLASAKVASVPIVKAKLAGVSAVGAKAKVVASIPAAKLKVLPAAKAKLAGAAVGAKATMAASVPAAKLKVLPAAKAKLAGVAAFGGKAKIVASIPAAKAKFAGISAVPAAKLKAVSVPVAKAKLAAGVSVPVAKWKVASMSAAKLYPLPLAKAAVPIKAKSIPLVKVAAIKPKFVLSAASIPVVKAKAFSTYSISPMTKKALALGYKKLLKTKKFALMG